MTCRISRCHSCGEYFDTKRLLRTHIDKNHRITNSKILVVAEAHSNILPTTADTSESLF